MDLGNFQAAIRDTEEACQLHAALAADTRTDLRARYAQLRATQGVVLDVAGLGGEALVHFDESIADLQQLAEAGRQDAELSLAQALMNRGFARINLGEIGAAMQDEERALAILRRRSPNDRRTKGFIAHTLLNIAEAQFRQGRRAESHELQTQGEALFQELASAGVPCQAILADAISKSSGSEGIAIEADRAWKQVEEGIEQLGALPAGREALDKFRDLVKNCQIIDEAKMNT
jgi:tetratricopeptide (TPR) repeat protein